MRRGSKASVVEDEEIDLKKELRTAQAESIGAMLSNLFSIYGLSARSSRGYQV
jgi:hypothetical protein